MKLCRYNIFETNSSSTHDLVVSGIHDDYLPPNSTILVRFINTDDDTYYGTLQEKISYLVSHIVRRYINNASTYKNLIDDVKDSWDFKRLDDYVYDHFNKRIVFPEKYEYNLDDIVYINHQLLESSLENVLDDLVRPENNLLDIVLDPNKAIRIGHD